MEPDWREKSETDVNEDSIEIRKEFMERNTSEIVKNASVYPFEVLEGVCIISCAALVYSTGLSDSSERVTFFAERVSAVELNVIVSVSDMCGPSSNAILTSVSVFS